MDGIMLEITPIVGVALEVLAGKWGNGDERKARLESAGYDYLRIQECVNDLIEIRDKYQVK